jgi:hypothetical protein
MNNTLRIKSEQFVSHSDVLTDGQRTVEGTVYLRYTDEQGNAWRGERLLKIRLKREREPKAGQQ